MILTTREYALKEERRININLRDYDTILSESYTEYLEEDEKEREEKDDWECELADRYNDDAKCEAYLNEIGWYD